MLNDRCPWCMAKTNGDAICKNCGHTVLEYTPQMHHLPLGTVLADRYVVGRALGEGGFGITYVGFDQTLHRRIAIKEYFPVGSASRYATASLNVSSTVGKGSESFKLGRERFLNEARAMARVSGHDALVGVIDFFQDNGTAYIIMEYVEGKSLIELCDERGGSIPFDEFIDLIDPVLEALGSLHEAGLVHRDISPDNIMVGSSGARLIDFGCAREFVGDESNERTMTVMLKYDYAAPEQYGRGGQGPWTDVYGMSATIYRCITGNLPPRALERLSGDELHAPSELGVSIPAPAEEVLLRGLNPKPEDRPQTIGELREGLHAKKSGSRWGSGSTTKVLLGAVAVLLVAVVAIVVMLTTGTSANEQSVQSVESSVSQSASQETETVSQDEDEKEDDGIQLAMSDVLPNRLRLSAGASHTVALRENGTAVATAPPKGDANYGQCDVGDWYDLSVISAGGSHTVGVHNDGTVVAVGLNDQGQCNVSDWNVREVSCGLSHTVGIRNDGTCVATGWNGYGQCDVSDWKDIVAVAAGDAHTVGLKSDGTVVAVGSNDAGQCDVSDWRSIVAISAGMVNTVGLKSDGTVVATSIPSDKHDEYDFGQCDVGGWSNIVMVSAGWRHTVGLRSDGTLVAVGLADGGACNVRGWPDAMGVAAGGNHTVALLANGTLKATGLNADGQCNVAGLLS